MPGLFEHKGHLLRVAVLFVAAVAFFLLLQRLFVPEGFGAYGHYRGGALADNRVRPLVYAGRAACLDCHGDQGDALQMGGHATVGCESCHGPLARHAADPSATAVARPEPGALCIRCHQRSAAKPAAFPQVDAADHAGGEACTSCHSPHHPLEPSAAEPSPAGRAVKGGDL